MWILMDETDFVRQRGDVNGPTGGMKSLAREALQQAEYVVVLKHDTYRVVKNRYEDDMGEFPIEELPQLIKDKLTASLRRRDNIDIREED